jgi:signal recognition particle subunit SRP54
MGDIVSLVEKAQEQTDEKEAKRLQDRMLKGQFDLDDFLEQLQKLRNMGPLNQLLEMIPGIGTQLRQAKAQVNEDDLKRIEAIIHSMTTDERRNPHVIGRSRRLRIARGSGSQIHEVKDLINQFDQMKKMMGDLGAMAKKGKMPRGFPPMR